MDWSILGGRAAFVTLTLALGLSAIALREEIVFLGSLGVILFVMDRLFRSMDPVKRRAAGGPQGREGLIGNLIRRRRAAARRG